MHLTFRASPSIHLYTAAMLAVLVGSHSPREGHPNPKNIPLHADPQKTPKPPELTVQELLQKNFSEDFKVLKLALEKQASRKPSDDWLSCVKNLADQASCLGDLVQANQTLNKFNQLPQKEKELIFNFVVAKLEKLFEEQEEPKVHKRIIEMFLDELKLAFQRNKLLSFADIDRAAALLNEKQRLKLLEYVSKP